MRRIANMLGKILSLAGKEGDFEGFIFYDLSQTRRGSHYFRIQGPPYATGLALEPNACCGMLSAECSTRQRQK